MATLDDSPSLFTGQNWSAWAEHVDGEHSERGEQSERPKPSTSECSTMKLRREDMVLYGLCPARDEFYLVICELCGQVIKPQALKEHIEVRHSRLCEGGDIEFSPVGGAASDVHPRAAVRPASASSLPIHKSPLDGHGEPMSGSPAPSMTHKTGGTKGSSCGRASSKNESKLMKSASSSSLSSKSKNGRPGLGVHRASIKANANPVVKMTRIGTDVSRAGLNQTVDSKITAISSSGSSFNDNSNSSDMIDSLSGDHNDVTPIKVEQGLNLPDRDKSLAQVLMSSPPPNTTALVEPETSVVMATVVPVATTTASITLSLCTSNVSVAQTSSPVQYTPTMAVTAASIAPVKVEPVNTLSKMSTLSSSQTKTTNVVTMAGMISTPKSSTSTSTLHRSSSGGKTKSKAPKFVPCKDREFDPNIHCGVIVPETNKSCTRSLTCKSHALSLRRSVQGRCKPFDQLIKEHREAKEADQKAKAEASGLSPPSSVTKTKSLSQLSVSGSIPCMLSPTRVSDPHKTGAQPLGRMTLPMSVQRSSSAKVVPKLAPVPVTPSRPSVTPVFPCNNESVPLPDTSMSFSSDGEDDDDNTTEKLGYPCLSHHPRPLAVNSFGGWMHGRGCYVFNRKQDMYRAAFMAAVERHLHPPPHKKLCVESKLPLGSHISTDPARDPYEFGTESGGLRPPGMSSVAASLAGNMASKVLPKHKTLGKTLPIVGTMVKPLPSKDGVGTSMGIAGSMKGPLHAVSLASLAHKAGSVIAPGSGVATNGGVKRKRSGSNPGVTVSLTGGNVSANNGMTTIAGTAPLHTASHPISITIPASSLNLSLATSALNNATLTAKAGAPAHVFTKNNFNLKDFNIVVTNMDSAPGGVLNGQLVNIANTGLADVTHLQLNNIGDKAAKTKISKGMSVKSKPASGFTGVQPAPGSINAFLTALPTSTIVMDTTRTTSISNSNSARSTPLPSPRTSPGPPQTSSGCSSPHVTTQSPLANGLVPPSHLSNKSNHMGMGGGSILNSPPTFTTMSNPVSLSGVTEQLLSQALNSSGKADTGCVTSGRLGLLPGNKSIALTTSGVSKPTPPTQVTLTAATAQQFAAAALNPLLAANSVPQLYTTLNPNALGGVGTPIQFQTKSSLKGPSTQSKGMQPVSLTIVAPTTMVGTATAQPGLVLQGDANKSHLKRT